LAKLHVAVLASGRGTNLQSVLAACASGLVDGDVVAVISDEPGSPALGRARKAKVPAHGIAPPPRAEGARTAHEAQIQKVLHDARPGLVVLAGYVRVLSPEFVRAWQGKLVNIHPSLLPSFSGRDGQGDAHAYGAKIVGCTTHFVDEQVDHGPIILQAAVLARADDTRDVLADRILAAEHRVLPRTIDLFQQGRLVVGGRRVRILPGDSWRTKLPVPPDVLDSEGY
jgi:phosphoribosylglycinamide formyltransferase-1